MTTEKQADSNRLVNAYNAIINQLHQLVKKTEKEVKPKIIHAFENLDEQAEHLGDLTREEIDLLNAYIVRDLHDAAEFIEENSLEFKDWMNLKIDIAEGTLLDSMPALVDETRIALDQIKERADRFGEWHSGEVVAPGVFECKDCKKRIELHKTAHIPPCAKCHGSVFKRVHQ